MPFHKRYFFFDYDGTLTDRTSCQVPLSAQRVLSQLHAQGHFLCIATGRQCSDIRSLARPLGIQNFVTDGGYGLVLENRLIRLCSMDPALCHRFLDGLEQNQIPWGIACQNDTVRHTSTQTFLDRAWRTGARSVLDPDLDYHACRTFYKIYVVVPEGQEDTVPMLSQFNWVRADENYLCVEPFAKGEAIRAMMALLQAPAEDVVVFGDSKNDLCMFSPDWTSIAMGDAPPLVLQKADYITPPAAKDGLAHACRHFGWI